MEPATVPTSEGPHAASGGISSPSMMLPPLPMPHPGGGLSMPGGLVPDAAGGMLPAPSSSAAGKPPKRGVKRNPEAPKRPMSPYVTFVKAKWNQMNEDMGPSAAAKDVMRALGVTWNAMSTEEKEKWKNMSDADKARYASEMRVFDGPVTVPAERRRRGTKKKTRRDPNAPKRGPSAFLLFANDKRQALREQHPDKHNVEISKMFGAIWKAANDETKQPYLDAETEARDRYDKAMTQYRREHREAMVRQQMLYGGKPPEAAYGPPQFPPPQHFEAADGYTDYRHRSDSYTLDSSYGSGSEAFGVGGYPAASSVAYSSPPPPPPPAAPFLLAGAAVPPAPHAQPHHALTQPPGHGGHVNGGGAVPPLAHGTAHLPPVQPPTPAPFAVNGPSAFGPTGSYGPPPL